MAALPTAATIKNILCQAMKWKNIRFGIVVGWLEVLFIQRSVITFTTDDTAAERIAIITAVTAVSMFVLWIVSEIVKDFLRTKK